MKLRFPGKSARWLLAVSLTVVVGYCLWHFEYYGTFPRRFRPDPAASDDRLQTALDRRISFETTPNESLDSALARLSRMCGVEMAGEFVSELATLINSDEETRRQTAFAVVMELWQHRPSSQTDLVPILAAAKQHPDPKIAAAAKSLGS